ncbi:predicted protein [Nematostella vectensis]|uniref:Potassium channel domain-containing protein n=1 Tax=Nematostella vectensis TaxID=45351 RepID=A7SCL6_NEMVE|nr:predicted protein [Nematostella vectensis]|eukprot:XP_001630601.1 predicted protein [Nematostella vectensis]
MRVSVVFFVFCGLVAGVQSACSRSNSTCRGTVMCPSCVSVAWFERVPYVYRSENDTAGILPDILRMLLHKCCEPDPSQNALCLEIYHKSPRNDSDRLLLETSTADIIYPTLVDLKTSVAPNAGAEMIGLIPPSSIAFVVPKGKLVSFPMKLLSAVFEAWPVLIFTLLLSICSGTLLWSMELKTNPEHFPRSFFRGSWEGFWWAFVSMTTVGYGDRCPQTVLGRIFAVAWILLGVCIVSIFTATLTTSLTAISLDKRSIAGSKVGVLERSIEFAVAMNEQADIQVYRDVNEIRQALDKREIDGVLLDNYQISHFSEVFPDSLFKKNAVVRQDGMAYGAIINDPVIRACFNRILARDRYLVVNFVSSQLSKTVKVGKKAIFVLKLGFKRYLLVNFVSSQLSKTVKAINKEAVKNSQSIFDPTGDLFLPSLYTCIVIVLVIFVIGVIAEIVYLNPSGCLRRRAGIVACFRSSRRLHPTSYKFSKDSIEMKGVSPSQVDELERQLIGDIQAVFKSYRDKLGGVDKLAA